MNKRKKIEKKINSYLYNHIWLKYVIDYFIAFVLSVVSAAIFAFGINTFLDPNIPNTMTLISGGSSGLAQNIKLIFSMFGVTTSNSSLIFSIAYFAINIPLLILAFFGIGKRFTIFTLVNVGFVTLFTNLFHGQFFDEIALFINQYGGLAARALFAGICTGLSSAIAFRIDASAGGFDIVSYYLSLRKNTTTGKYIILINAIIISTFSVLTGFSGVSQSIGEHTFSSWTVGVAVLLFSIIYLLTTMLIIDFINIRNKKVQVQINTVNKDLPRLLISNIPHGATIMQGTGAYSGTERIIIYMIISSVELKTTLDTIKEIDPDSFVSVISLYQVYGRFFMKPVR